MASDIPAGSPTAVADRLEPIAPLSLADMVTVGDSESLYCTWAPPAGASLLATGTLMLKFEFETFGGDILQPWARIALAYGLVSFFTGPALGASARRLVGYGWPAFLLAGPLLLVVRIASAGAPPSRCLSSTCWRVGCRGRW
jgi:hypothetical protein